MGLKTIDYNNCMRTGHDITKSLRFALLMTLYSICAFYFVLLVVYGSVYIHFYHMNSDPNKKFTNNFKYITFSDYFYKSNSQCVSFLIDFVIIFGPVFLLWYTKYKYDKDKCKKLVFGSTTELTS